MANCSKYSPAVPRRTAITGSRTACAMPACTLALPTGADGARAGRRCCRRGSCQPSPWSTIKQVAEAAQPVGVDDLTGGDRPDLLPGGAADEPTLPRRAAGLSLGRRNGSISSPRDRHRPTPPRGKPTPTAARCAGRRHRRSGSTVVGAGRRRRVSSVAEVASRTIGQAARSSRWQRVELRCWRRMSSARRGPAPAPAPAVRRSRRGPLARVPSRASRREFAGVAPRPDQRERSCARSMSRAQPGDRAAAGLGDDRGSSGAAG